jgi:hypothetical protein
MTFVLNLTNTKDLVNWPGQPIVRDTKFESFVEDLKFYCNDFETYFNT